MNIFGKLLVYGGLIAATLISVYSCVLWPNYKLDTETIIEAVERDAAKIDLNEEQLKDFKRYMGWLKWNDQALHEWGAERGGLNLWLYLIYLVSILVLLRAIRQKNKIIKELENSSGSLKMN